jgi:hypothetical protein
MPFISLSVEVEKTDGWVGSVADLGKIPDWCILRRRPEIIPVPVVSSPQFGQKQVAPYFALSVDMAAYFFGRSLAYSRYGETKK